MNESMDAMDWTPEQACQSAAELCRVSDPDAALVILLKEGRGNIMTFRNSGLSAQQMISLLESFKFMILNEYIFNKK